MTLLLGAATLLALSGCAAPGEPEAPLPTGSATPAHAPWNPDTYHLLLFLESVAEAGSNARMAVEVTGERPANGTLEVWMSHGDMAPAMDEDPCAVRDARLRDGKAHLHAGCRVEKEGNHTAVARLTVDGAPHAWTSEVLRFTAANETRTER